MESSVLIARFLTAVSRKKSQLGGCKAAAFLARRLCDTLFHSRDLFFTIDLSEPTFTGDPRNTVVNVREKRSFSELTEKEREAIQCYGGSTLLSLFEERLAGGHRLFLTYAEGKFAGAAWVYVGGSERFFMIPLAEKEFFIVAVFILERFRGRGISVPSLVLLLKKMREDAFVRGFICTKEWNFYQRSIKKAGFELVGRVRRLRFFGRDILIWSHDNGWQFV